MRQEDATAFTAGCFNGEPASCTYACPYRLDIRTFLEKAEKGRWNAAYKALRDAMVFPVIASALCPAPCEGNCQRTAIGDEPIDVKLIEDACIRYAKSRKPDNYVIPPKTERIAVVGAGLAGLTGALGLAQKKFNVTVFDKNPGWGGILRTHPRFAEFDEDIALQFSAANAEFKFNTSITSLEELSGFDAVYLATGAEGDDFGLLTGWDEKLLTTSEPRIFAGGALAGADTAKAIVQGLNLSKTIEVFLQTGKASETYGAELNGCAKYVGHEGTPSMPRIVPSEPPFYTEDEAKAEAARCMKCDCDKCISSCEMLSTFRKKPKKIAVEVFTDTQVNPPYSSHTLTRQAYSCNMCGHCKETCPEDSDIGGLLRLSRKVRMESGQYPAALHDYWLREMDFYSGEASFYSAPYGEEFCEYLFFPGCQLGAHNPAHVLKSYEFLSKNYNAGVFLGCCGAPAYWAGDDERLDGNFIKIREAAKTLGNPKFVFACATCESIFEKFLPEIRRVSLYELLADAEEITPRAVYNTASVFDPCNARKNSELESAVRKLAQRSGAELMELSEKNRCCGWGGHMMLANPELFDKITENRAAMSANPYIVYCANCREIFVRRGKECAHILDIAFGLPDSGRAVTIEAKHKGALAVKGEFMKAMTGVELVPERNDWDDLALALPDELGDSIDRKLISLMDIREAIWRAETTGDKFVDDESGVCRCCMERSVLTYWVAYRKLDGGGFEVLEAYCHRMRFSREEA